MKQSKLFEFAEKIAYPTIQYPEIKIIGIKLDIEKILLPKYSDCRILWPHFNALLPQITNRVKKTDWRKYGVTFYSHEIGTKFYLACVEVSDFDFIPSGMIKQIIPKFNYSIFIHNGTLDKLADTYKNLFQKFAQNHQNCLNTDLMALNYHSLIHFEKYDKKFQWNSRSEIDICFPIIKQ
jgi:predicted transcriptional regulator YdeE